MVRLGSQGTGGHLIPLYLNGALLKDNSSPSCLTRNLVEYTVDQSHPCKIAPENQTVLSSRFGGRGWGWLGTIFAKL